MQELTRHRPAARFLDVAGERIDDGLGRVEAERAGPRGRERSGVGVAGRAGGEGGLQRELVAGGDKGQVELHAALDRVAPLAVDGVDIGETSRAARKHRNGVANSLTPTRLPALMSCAATANWAEPQAWSTRRIPSTSGALVPPDVAANGDGAVRIDGQEGGAEDAGREAADVEPVIQRLSPVRIFDRVVADQPEPNVAV